MANMEQIKHTVNKICNKYSLYRVSIPVNVKQNLVKLHSNQFDTERKLSVDAFFDCLTIAINCKQREQT